jgi:CopG family transcriptional regulator/antitoxin EndoAI
MVDRRAVPKKRIPITHLLDEARHSLLEYYRVTSEKECVMRTTKPITVSLPLDLLQETQRVALEEARTRTDLIRDALRQYLASRRWQRLREWGAETAERLGLKTEADLQRLLDTARASRGKATR